MIEIDSQPWFVARDICVALSVYIGPKSGQPNVTMAIQKLNEDEFQFNRIELTPGYPRNAVLVSESGLYKIVMRSDKPEARRFQEWVTREVLPAIRKDGMYVVGEEKLKTGELTPSIGGSVSTSDGVDHKSWIVAKGSETRH